MSDQPRHENEPEPQGDSADAEASKNTEPDAAPAASDGAGAAVAEQPGDAAHTQVIPDAVGAADAQAAETQVLPDAADAAAETQVIPEAAPAEPVVPPVPPAPVDVTAPPASPAVPPAPPTAEPSAVTVPPAPPAPGGSSAPPAPQAGSWAAPAPGTAPAPGAAPGGQFAPAGAPSAPAAVGGAGAWFAPFTPKVAVGALAHVGIAVGASFVGGLILLLVLLTLGSSDAGSTPIGNVDDMLSGFGTIISLLFTLTAVIVGGELTVSLGGDFGFFSGGGSASLWVFPLLLTLGAMVAVFWWGVRQGRVDPLPTRLHRAAYGFAVGLVTGLVLLVIALIFAVRVDAQGIGFELTAAGYRVVLFATLLVGLAAYLGREAGALALSGQSWVAAGWRLLQAAPRVVREWLTYTAFGAASFGLLGVIFVIASAWDDTGASIIGLALVGGLNIAPYAAAIGHLGGVSAGGGILGGASSSSTLTVFNGDSGWLWLAVLVAVLLTLFTALWIGTRRPRTNAIDWRSSWQLPVVVLAAWLIIGSMFFGIGIGASGSAGMFGGALNGGAGIALWSALVFLVWAALVEIGSQTMPRIAYGLAPAALGAIVGRRTLAAWVAGTPASAPVAYAAVDGSVPPPPGGAAPAPAALGAPLAEPTPLSPAAKRGLIIGGSVVGGLVVLGIVGSVAVGIINSGRSADAVAQQYLEHLAAGEAEAANALVDPNVSNSERQYLTDAVLAAAKERISEIKVSSAEKVGDRAMIPVSYKLDGQTHETYLEAQKGDPEWLVLDTWELTSSLATQTAFYANGPASVSIGGVSLEGGDEMSAVLYPAIYELGTDGSTYFALQDPQLIVEGGVGGVKELQFAPTDALRDEVATQVNALLAKCVESTAADPEGCPFDVYTYNDDTKVKWTLQGEPTIEVSESGRQVEVEGTAIGSYTEEFFGTKRDEADEDNFSMYGEISIEGETVTLTFQDSWW